MKDYFLSPQAVSRAFDSMAVDRQRSHADTRFALIQHLTANAGKGEGPHDRIQWLAIAHTIRQMARQRSGSALAFLLHQLGPAQGMAGVPSELGACVDAALLWTTSEVPSVRATPCESGWRWQITATCLDVEDHRKADSYLLVAETETSTPAIFLLSAGLVIGGGRRQAESGALLPASLNAVLAKRCFPLAFDDESPEPAMIILWFSSLLCGMADRLFSLVKMLYRTCDPRRSPLQSTPPKLHNCLAHIDALLLSQALSLRAMHVESQNENLNVASIQSNAQQVADSAIDAGNLVLSTLRELQYSNELDAITRQVRSIAAVHKLATDSVNVISFSDSHSADDEDRLYG
jgi:hypothetical protein